MVSKSSPTRQLEARSQQQRAARVPHLPVVHGATRAIIDARQVRPPSKVYAADHAWVTQSGGSFLFTFWQEGLFGEAAASALGIKMHAFYVRKFLDSVDTMNSPGLDEICRNLNLDAASISALEARPEQAAKMTANIALLAISGYEASLDYFEASPASLHKAKIGNGIADVELDPMVRVMLETTLLVAVVRRTKELMTTVKGVIFDE